MDELQSNDTDQLGLVNSTLAKNLIELEALCMFLLYNFELLKCMLCCSVMVVGKQGVPSLGL